MHEGLALTQQLGADLVIHARRKKGDIVKEVIELTGREGCYATVNLSGAKQAPALAYTITRIQGRMIEIAQVSLIAAKS